jgi:hypothetical protein
MNKLFLSFPRLTNQKTWPYGGTMTIGNDIKMTTKCLAVEMLIKVFAVVHVNKLNFEFL